MSDVQRSPQKRYSPDWFVQGVLARLGDAFDRFTGRDWRPSSSLATSELIERLKTLLDAEARVDAHGRKYVPHNIKLKTQWDKFSTDLEDSVKKLEAEMLTAVVDHINDRHYYTYAPLSLEVKPDYFTNGVKLYVTFDEVDEQHEAEVDVHATETNLIKAASDQGQPMKTTSRIYFRFVEHGDRVERKLNLEEGKRISIGRTKENGLTIDDPSVSKIHASLLLTPDRRVMVADTGSTNGTFVGGERIPYGKAFEVSTVTDLAFGSVKVDVEFAALPDPTPNAEVEEVASESVKIGDFEFRKPGQAHDDSNLGSDMADRETSEIRGAHMGRTTNQVKVTPVTENE